MADYSGQVKGLILIGTTKWIRENYGDEGFNLFLQKLPANERQDWAENTFLSSTLVPASYYKHMYEAVMSIWGKNDPLIFHKAAGAVAFYDLNRIFKLVMKISTPSFVASKFQLVWSQYFTSGAFTITNTFPNGIEGEITGAGIYGLAGCEGALGWAKRALENAGAKRLEAVQYECRFRGDASCKLRFKWE